MYFHNYIGGNFLMSLSLSFLVFMMFNRDGCEGLLKANIQKLNMVYVWVWFYLLFPR